MSEEEPSPGFANRDEQTVFRPSRPFLESRAGSGPSPADLKKQEDQRTPLSAENQTVFLPNPAGRRAQINPSQSKMTELGIFPKGGFPRQAAVQGAELGAPNENPLLQAAGPLLLLLGRLRCALLRAQTADLIPQIGEAVQKFTADCERAQLSIDMATNAKYMLCLTADEVLSH